MHATIATDAVECNIPLLLSKAGMEKAKIVLHFETDSVKIGGKGFQLKSSSSGHNLVSLSL